MNDFLFHQLKIYFTTTDEHAQITKDNIFGGKISAQPHKLIIHALLSH